MHSRTTTITKLSCALLLFATSAISEDNRHNRRSFFGKIRDAYIQGRFEANEKRVIERKEAEKMRRRAVFERNVKSLVDGLSRRLKRGPNQFKLIVVGGVILIIWLCHRGSVGCDRDRRAPQNNFQEAVINYRKDVLFIYEEYYH